ncbi:MAG: hypothetical protein K8J08_14570 [Thermoanaerobaculia bacterium]|nr:hypothetical protein [Thermoanaerobaculia bacterium]
MPPRPLAGSRSAAARLLRIVAPLALLSLLVACFDVQQDVKINQDLSGTARIAMSVDLEPMVHMMASMKRGFEGKEGPPTAEELDAARKDFQEQQAAEQASQFEEQTADIKARLPEGVRLVSAKMSEGESIGADFLFEFDHISKLQQIKLDDKGEEGSGTDSPFAQLIIEEKDGTLLISTPPINPAEDLGTMGLSEEEEDDSSAMVKESMESMRVRFELTAPFEVLEQNATEIKGKTLIWDYGYEALTEMAKEGAEVEPVRVLYKM